jgi:UDP-glucose 4-epimerase
VRVLVTGGAGFIGSHVCDRALAGGAEVVAFDDLSTGRELFLADALRNPHFRLVRGDVRDLDAVAAAAEAFRPDWTIHLAANADVRYGLEHPRRDLDYNTIGTWNVLEAARRAGCRRFLFSSTGSVYGEPEVFPTPEDAPFPEQTSLYGASKLAGEGLIAAYAHGFGMTGVVFRFVSILGPRYTHGHVYDFVRSLRADPSRLRVLGDGRQEKSYLHVDDLMDGLWLVVEHVETGGLAAGRFHAFNIGHDDTLLVDRSVAVITRRMGLEPAIEHMGGTRGWIGDSPRIQLDTNRLKALGWTARRSLEESVVATVDYLLENSAVLDRG